MEEEKEIISEFFDLNKEMTEINKKRSKICMNPECENISYLKDGERPQIMLGRFCWHCKSDNFLKDYTEPTV